MGKKGESEESKKRKEIKSEESLRAAMETESEQSTRLKESKRRKKIVLGESSEPNAKPLKEESLIFDELKKRKNIKLADIPDHVVELKKLKRLGSGKSKKRKCIESAEVPSLVAEPLEEDRVRNQGSKPLKQFRNLQNNFLLDPEIVVEERSTIDESRKRKKVAMEEVAEAVADSIKGSAVSSKSKKRTKIMLEDVPELVAESVQDSKKRRHIAIEAAPEPVAEREENGRVRCDESRKRTTVATQEVPEAVAEPKKRKKVFPEPAAELVVETGTSESTEKVDVKVDEPRKKKMKMVRFQEPAEDALQENVTISAPEASVEDDLTYVSEVRNWKRDHARQDLKYGRFTKFEDEKIKTGVYSYIRMRGWDVNEGLQTVLRPSEHTDARGCWLEIAKVLPYRPVKQINSRAQRILGGDKRGKWSKEEQETLKDLFDMHGHNWKKIAAFMDDRSPQLCKDQWRKLRLHPTRKMGSWNQDEFDNLSKLVRKSLRIKASLPPKKFDRRQIRDDINWEWIAEQMQRDSARCASTWYARLASPMVCDKKWANEDDRLFLQSLMASADSSEDAVDWDSILDHRDGPTCMKRWAQMSRLLGPHTHVSFEDKLEILAKRFSPDLVGIEEAQET